MNPYLLLLIALLFGAVEGFTEFLPISSTGHMILLEGVFSSCGSPLSEAFPHGQEFWSLFLVVVQLGAILSVIVLFWSRLWPWGKKKLTPEENGLIQRGEKTEEEIQKGKKKQIWRTWLKVLIGVLPAAAVGLILDLTGWEDAMQNWAVVSCTLIVYGIAFLVIETLKEKRNWSERIPSILALGLKDAFFIGCFQVLALIPGTSRSGVTILGALLLGCSRTAAAEFSFYLSIPVMVGASLLKIAKFFLRCGVPTPEEIVFLFTGMIAAMAVAFLCVRWLMSFLRKKDFRPFGIYRIALGALVIAFFLTFRLLSGQAVL